MTADPWLPALVRVRASSRETADTVTLTLDAPGGTFPFRPGQFSMLWLHGQGEVPLSFSGDPAEPGVVRHTVRAVGRHYGEAALAVGHSLGGAALVLAQDERWRAQRLVLVAPAIDVDAAASRYFRFVRLGEHLRPRFYDWLVARTGVSVEQLQMHRHAAALGQPGLVVHDLDDRDVPWDEGERYARHWPAARLLTTEGLGHHRVLDAPQPLAAALAFARGETVGERVVASANLPFGLA